MVLVTTIQFTVGLVMAVLVNQKLRGRLVFRTLFFVPVILGVAVQGLMWKLFLRPGGGPMDSIFGWFGLESQFLAGPNAFYWVIVVQIWANAGFTMIIFLAGMQTIPADLYEAAAVDGASGWKLFKNITWPQLTPAVNTNFLLNIVGSLQAWMLFLVLTGYKNGTQVLGYVVYAEAFGQTGTARSGRATRRLHRSCCSCSSCSSGWPPTPSSTGVKGSTWHDVSSPNPTSTPTSAPRLRDRRQRQTQENPAQGHLVRASWCSSHRSTSVRC